MLISMATRATEKALGSMMSRGRSASRWAQLARAGLTSRDPKRQGQQEPHRRDGGYHDEHLVVAVAL